MLTTDFSSLVTKIALYIISTISDGYSLKFKPY